MRKILIIHQNFPGQYIHLAPALAALGDNVVALTPKVDAPTKWRGVNVVPYAIPEARAQGQHPWLADFETKLIRGHACYNAAMALREKGFFPDLILAHHGWGESLFLKDVWPQARMGLYCELYHLSDYPHTQFDPEFQVRDAGSDALRLRMKNLSNRLHAEFAESGISPMQFQAKTFPQDMLSRITVCHDGIDTDALGPNADAQLDVTGGQVLTRDDEVITFINRNLEPYRGYHVFMRALPDLLAARPRAQVVMIGGDEVSYGAPHPSGKSWKQVMIDEISPRMTEGDWNRVHFLGRVPYERYIAMMQVSRAHVYLSYPFVLSWSVLEAMAMHTPLIASGTEAVREVLKDGENALLVDFFDQNAIIEKVCETLDAPDRAAIRTAQARCDVVTHYDLQKVCLPRQLEWVRQLERAPLRAATA